VRKLVVITGISGSGKSTALDSFEDVGFFCIDNLPAPLTPSFVQFIKSPPADWKREDQPFALLVESRDASEAEQTLEAIAALRAAKIEVTVLFFDCRDEIILRRYQETRRPHPLLSAQQFPAGDQSAAEFRGSIADALNSERQILSSLRVEADRIFDTSTFSPHQLRQEVQRFVAAEIQLGVTLLSFGFKYGPPKDADLIVDVRFLPNPHFVPELRERTGLEESVAQYVLNFAESREFLTRYGELLQFLVPQYEREGKRYLTIAIGCTGGKHRSVVLAEELKRFVPGALVRHRDRERQ